jgi:hypothetical protein
MSRSSTVGVPAVMTRPRALSHSTLEQVMAAADKASSPPTCFSSLMVISRKYAARRMVRKSNSAVDVPSLSTDMDAPVASVLKSPKVVLVPFSPNCESPETKSEASLARALDTSPLANVMRPWAVSSYTEESFSSLGAANSKSDRKALPMRLAVFALGMRSSRISSKDCLICCLSNFSAILN